MTSKKTHIAVLATAFLLAVGALIPSLLFNTSQEYTAKAAGSTARYNIGSPTMTDIWVSTNGNDSNNGSQTSPVRTFSRAWEMIPANQTLTTGYRVRFAAGTYNNDQIGGRSFLPNYMENRWGTAQAPVLLQAEGNVQINGNLNIYNVRYFYIVGLKFTAGHDVIHFEKSDHVLVRNVTLRSNGRAAQETIKINQSQYVYIEDSNISGAWDNAIDVVGVQYGHMVGNKVHDANDWCAYVKGGAAYWIIEGNEFFNCGTGGVTAGQGAGIQFMVTPWVQYEAYDVKIYNNIIHDIEGAGLGVNGGYNILLANNTMYRVGSRDHVIEVVFGLHTCDGNDVAACTPILNAGGWGSTTNEDVFVGNRNIYIYNNIVYNPIPYRSRWTQFAIYAPRTNTVPGFRGPATAITDYNLHIKGNIIWNGPNAVELGIGDDQGCANSNPTCNPAQVLRDNAINTVEPQFTNAAGMDFSLPNSSNVFSVPAFAMPSFSWNDASNNVPTGTLTNTVNKDYFNTTRTRNVAGAITGTSTTASTSSPTIVPTNTPTAVPTSAPTTVPTSTPIPTPTPTTIVTVRPTTTPAPTSTVRPTTPPTPATGIASDLEGYWNGINTTCTTRRNIQTCTMRTSLHIHNDGERNSPNAHISVYLSTNNTFDTSDIKIKDITLKALRSGTGRAIAFSYSARRNYHDTPYLIAVIDDTNKVSESDESDNYAISDIF
ncbi:MAG: right-handed parallel beta-helix repeat-containing protein [Candidatus Abawacabacteria bacterium]|nr:right-handed parallel beta-helix repeat-containing protein [Candidatus Abawacabacteria bacterium]